MIRFKEILTAALLMSAIVLVRPAFSAETTVGGRIYGQWMMDLSGGADNFNAFSMERSYATIKSKLSDQTSVRITSDLREIDDKYDIILKYAYFDWKPSIGKASLTFRMGLQPTLYIDEMNGLWGRRYLMKTIGDELKFLTSADLGATAIIGLGEKSRLGFVSLTAFNGTSYSSVTENNKQKDLNLVARVTPLVSDPNLRNSALMAQFYSGTQNEVIPDSISASDWKHQIISAGGLFAYDSTVDLGFDLNMMTMGAGPGTSDIKSNGFSFFGTLYLAGFSGESSLLRTLDLFARADIYDPNTNVDKDGRTMILGGVECSPVKGFKASVNYRTISFQADGVDSQSGIYLNTLVKF